MADSTISGLTTASTLTGTEVVPVDQSGVTVKATTQAIANLASGGVSSVSNSNGTLTISPTTGAVVASLALGHANTWTASQTWRAGSTSAATAPIYLQSGSLMSTAEVGAVEFLTDKYYATITTGAARKELALNDAALTSGRVPVVTTNGRLTDDSGLTYDATNDRLMVGTATTTAGCDVFLQKTVAGQMGYVVQNQSTGTASFTSVFLNNSNGAIAAGISLTSSGWTTSGVLVANSTQFFSGYAGPVNISSASGQAIQFSVDAFATACAKFDSSGNLNITEAKNVIIGTSTGTKIGTGTTQKIGFWNATPVAQKTGYGTPTGNVNQGSFAASSITLPNLAAGVAQLIIDLKAIGIIGA